MLEGHDGADVSARDVGAGVPHDNHSLLLSLAGLIDDELLGWSRELAAVGEFDHALELITATVVAEGVRLPEPVHAALLAAQRGRAGVELPAPEKNPVPGGPQHRFLADPAAAGYPAAVAGSSPVEALRGLPGRLLRGCRLWLSWRLTPAGGAPTPVPHPVLLIETSDGAGADLLAYQVADLLGRSGAFVSVEVFGPDSTVGAYHRAALDASVALDDLEFTGTSVRLDSPEDTASPASPLEATPLPQRESAVSSARPPLQPVERVKAARASSPRNPIDNVMPFERGPGYRPPADRPFPDRPLFDRTGPDPLDRPLVDRAPLDRPPADRPGFGGFDDGFGSGAQHPVPPRDQRGRARDDVPLGPVRPGGTGPADWPGPLQGPAGPPPKGPMTGAFPAQGPGSGPQGPRVPQGPAGPPPGSMSGAFPAQPTGPNAVQNPGQPGLNPGQPGPQRPIDRRPPERNGMSPRNGAGPEHNGVPPRNGAGPEHNGIERTAMMPERGPGPDRNGMGRNGAPGASTRAVPPAPPPVSQPTARQPAPPMGPGPQGAVPPGVVPQGAGPQGAGPQGAGPQGPGQPQAGPGPSVPGPVGPPPGQPQRPPLRPVDLPELPDGLSDVEQKLLRQLHEELAAREDGPSTAGQGPRGAYRNGSNGSARPQQKPMGPDQAG